MKKKLVILVSAGSCFLGSVLYAVLTGGVVVENLKQFGGQQSVTFAGGLESDLWIDPNHSGGGIPFVGFYYFTQLPCSLRVQIWDVEKKYTSIKIDTVVVEYTSGDKQTLNTGWSRNLQPYIQVNSSSGKIIRTPIMMLSDTIPGVIDRHSDCVVTLTGALTTSSGERLPFEIVEPFEYESDLRIYTFWEMLGWM